MPGLPEDLGRHVAGRSTCGRQDVELLFIHNSRETKVCNEKVGIVFWGSKEEVFWLEVSVDDTVIVEVGYGGESRSD